jgi:predicted butyrate kinase (DUF1464 family)
MAIVVSTSNGEDSSGILIEVEQVGFEGNEYRDMKAALNRISGLYDEALQLANDCARKVSEQITALAPAIRPAEYTIQFGIKLDAEVGAFIAKSTAGAQLQVSLKWISKQDASGS